MNELLIPEDYDILNSWVSEINGNDSEMEDLTMGFMRNNQNILGYMMVDKAQKYSCIGDGLIINGKDNKPWIESDGCFGKGMYFYEYNYRYAVDVAKSKQLDVVGAVINLNHVLDFTDGEVIELIGKSKEKFDQYLQKKVQSYNQKIQSLKNKSSMSFQKYKNELERLNCGNVGITDYLEFLKDISKGQKQYKIDAIRYCNIEYNNSFCGVPIYQSTMICLLDQKRVVEYFNPLNSQKRDYIEKKYFNSKSK